MLTVYSRAAASLFIVSASLFQPGTGLLDPSKELQMYFEWFYEALQFMSQLTTCEVHGKSVQQTVALKNNMDDQYRLTSCFSHTVFDTCVLFMVLSYPF